MSEIRRDDLSADAFQSALIAASIPYRDQPFFVPFDNAIISQVTGSSFKLWARNLSMNPIVVGSYFEEDGRLVIRWRLRPSPPTLFAYSGMVVYSSIMHPQAGAFGAFAAGLLLLIQHLLGRDSGQRIEHLLRTVRP